MALWHRVLHFEKRPSDLWWSEALTEENKSSGISGLEEWRLPPWERLQELIQIGLRPWLALKLPIADAQDEPAIILAP